MMNLPNVLDKIQSLDYYILIAKVTDKYREGQQWYKKSRVQHLELLAYLFI